MKLISAASFVSLNKSNVTLTGCSGVAFPVVASHQGIHDIPMFPNIFPRSEPMNGSDYKLLGKNLQPESAVFQPGAPSELYMSLSWFMNGTS